MATADYVVELLQDVRKSREHWIGADEQFWRRAGVRATFGAIEAWFSYVRAEMYGLVQVRKDAGLVTAEEELVAADLFTATDRYETVLTDAGIPKRQKRKVGFRPMLRATVRLNCVGRGLSATFSDGHFAKDGWRQLQDAVKVRDRLTHPHGPDDIAVTEDEITNLQAGLEWFRRLMDETTTESEKRTDALEAELRGEMMQNQMDRPRNANGDIVN
jgi:hypothetical protein